MTLRTKIEKIVKAKVTDDYEAKKVVDEIVEAVKGEVEVKENRKINKYSFTTVFRRDDGYWRTNHNIYINYMSYKKMLICQKK